MWKNFFIGWIETDKVGNPNTHSFKLYLHLKTRTFCKTVQVKSKLMSCKLSLKRKEQKERRSITTYIDVLSCRRGALGFSIFAVLAIFKIAFGFCAKKLRFFGFGVHCGLRIFRILAFGFRFSRKILTGFRIWYPMQFSVSPIWPI